MSSEVGCSIICVVCGTSRFNKRIIDIDNLRSLSSSVPLSLSFIEGPCLPFIRPPIYV